MNPLDEKYELLKLLVDEADSKHFLKTGCKQVYKAIVKSKKDLVLIYNMDYAEVPQLKSILNLAKDNTLVRTYSVNKVTMKKLLTFQSLIISFTIIPEKYITLFN